MVEIQWRALFGAYRYLESSLSESEVLTLLEDIFNISMSHIGLASERLGPGRRTLRNEYHHRLMKAGRAEEALRVALRFAQPRTQRAMTKPLDLATLQERLRPEEALWYGWFDKRGWKGWLIGTESVKFVVTDWEQTETEKVFRDITQRFRQYAPLGRSLEILSDAFSFLMKDQLDGVQTLKVLDVPGEAWVPYRALKVEGELLDERLKLEWALPILVDKTSESESLTVHLTEEFGDKALVFAALEQAWLGQQLGHGSIEPEAIFLHEGSTTYDGALQWFRAAGRCLVSS